MAPLAAATNPVARKLRVGVFAGGARQPRWMAQALAAAARSDFAEIVDFLRDFSKLNIVLEKEVQVPPLTLKVRETALGEVLELLTLPHGLDVRLEEGAIVLYRRP